MSVLLALAPIVLTLALLATPLPAWVAPAAGTVCAVILGLTVFGTPADRLAAALAGGVPTLIEIVAIIGGGITLARVMDLTGAHARLGAWLSAGTGPTLATALLMVHGVVPFLETVTGFGVSVIVGVPLLVGLGFTAFRAAVLAVVALTIGPWGSMGPGTLLGSQLGGLDLRELGMASAAWNLAPGIVSGLVVVLLLRGASGLRDDGPAPLGRRLAVGAASGVVQTGLILAANTLLGTAPAGAVGTLVLTVLWLAVVRGGRLSPGPGRDIVPYLVLLGGTVAGTTADTLLPLGGWGVVVGSPALWSFLASVVGAFLLGLDAAGARRLPREAGRLWASTAGPNVLYVLLGLSLAAGGAAAALAGALSGMGPAYLVALPFIGGLGGYITSSNTGSMAMFGVLQMQTAAALGVPALWAGGLHNAASGWAIIASPARLEVAYRVAMSLQREDMPGWAVSRRGMLAVLGPAAVVGLAAMAAAAPFLLPRG